MTGDMQYKLWLLDGYEVADGYIWLVMRLEAYAAMAQGGRA